MIFLLLTLLSRNEGYDNHDLVLLTSYKAKDICSCIFVQGRESEYFRQWTKAKPNFATISVDLENKVVHTEALQYWSASARWVSERHGCVLEDD